MKKTFDEIFEDRTKYGTKVKTDEYHENGIHIIIDQGQEQIAGYTDLEEGVFSDVPVVIFGDHTRVIKYVDEPFYLGADGVKVLKSRLEDANYKYLYYALKNVKIPNTGYNRHFKWLKDVSIEYPEKEKQVEIVVVLDKLQSVIESRKKELQKLDVLIKARFVEMFGDVKTNSFNWEKCTFDDVTTKITDGEHGTVPRVEEGEGYLYFMARNITKDGLIDLSEISYVPEEVHQKIYKRCNPEIDDILLVCVGATIGKSTLVTEELGEFSMARSVALLKPNNEKVNSVFLINLLKSDAIQNDISNCAHAAAQAGLYTNMIKSLDAFMPPIELQNQFADFVKQIDKSKVAIQKSLDETQQLFDALMQQYFG